MRLFVVFASTLLGALLTLTGCDNGPADKPHTATLTIDHAQGSTTVPLNPQKVIILKPMMLDNADALGIPVAGVPQTSSHLPPFLAKYTGHDYLNAGTLFEPDYEALSNARPDLIIAGGRAHDAYDKLSEIAPTIILDIDPEHFMASMSQRVQQLASIFGKQQQATTLLNNFQDRIKQIKAQAAQAGNAMVVMVSGGKMSAYSPGSRFGFLFDELGFQPATAFTETGPHGRIVTAEFISQADPAWLFVLDRDNAIGRAEWQSAQQVLDNALIHRTRAWRDKHVVYFDAASLYIAGGLQSYDQLLDKISATLAQPQAGQ
ncbi:siderophore ABC transporter substrate-binding protein [Candidatus Sodalis endolongispinus]|uniref:Siderophore ABC transporter substrate-binding protein n=1 Tax=Candidatus Sodalis endolongispinus TaxID=2812662 RepID=A0ABS5YD20_9GAMM|nr:siderophore ABC transporter substrate-binding protein [Candidatus Sodalis endolongispinus]MBT9432859.1 siderophore ABC transporter substrate-binding protein [Candidatus Sodalis endolongispinus]